MIKIASPWTADHARYSAPGLSSAEGGRLHQLIECGAKQLKRIQSALPRLCDVHIIFHWIRGRKCCSEESPLGQGKFEIPVPTAEGLLVRLPPANLCGTLTISASIASASDESAAALTACNRSRWLEKCR